jgi:hypothetical protein
MTDQREAILERLAVVCSEIEGVTTAARNKLQVADVARPALIVLDGNEDVEDGYGKGKPSVSPLVVTMRPEVWLFAGGIPEDIGAAVSAFRALIISAVLTDSQLLALCKDSDIRYSGCMTNFTAGQRIEADLALVFVLRYVLRPNEL